MNKDRIWDITGVCVPDSGSINPAKLSPVLAAIFSPASWDAENKILNKSPPVTPIISSIKIKIIKLNPANASISGIFILSYIKKLIEKETTILTCKGITL